jgi:hypothetical protein
MNKQNVQSKWLQTMQMPFAHPSCHVPDDRTTVSGLVTSREVFIMQPTSQTGAAQTAHTSGIVFSPYPASYRTTFVQQVADRFSSLKTDGDFYSKANTPNLAAALPNGGMVRLVSLGVRIIYEGTELQRAGKIFVGTAGANNSSISTAQVFGGAFNIEPLSVITGSVLPLQDTLKSTLTNSITSRISGGQFEVNWIPTGVPTYQTYPSAQAGYESLTTNSASATISSSFWNSPSGAAGVQSGQNFLVVIIEGDTTATAVAVGNAYSFEVISHWETIPVLPLGVAYDLTASLSDFTALGHALNRMSVSGGYRDSGKTSNLIARGVTVVPDFQKRQRPKKRPPAQTVKFVSVKSTPKSKRTTRKTGKKS